MVGIGCFGLISTTSANKVRTTNCENISYEYWIFEQVLAQVKVPMQLSTDNYEKHVSMAGQCLGDKQDIIHMDDLQVITNIKMRVKRDC